MGNLKVRRDSIKALERQLQATTQRVRQSVATDLRVLTRTLVNRAKQRAPYYTGATRSTAYTVAPEQVSDGVKASLGFAGPDSDRMNPETGRMVSEYIAEIHEGYGPAGQPLVSGEPKFLENTINESKEEFRQFIARSVADALTGR